MFQRSSTPSQPHTPEPQQPSSKTRKSSFVVYMKSVALPQPDWSNVQYDEMVEELLAKCQAYLFNHGEHAVKGVYGV